MIIPSPAKIVIGISLDADESEELLCWAIKILAHPGDTVVALHVIETKPNKKADGQRKEDGNKWEVTKKYQKHVRQAKSFVISVTGELVKSCQSKEVNLEARVGLNYSAGRGLIEEAKTMAADYLVIGNKRNPSNRATRNISKYCFENVPEGCSLVLVNRTGRLQEDFRSNSTHFQEFDIQSSSRWSEKNFYSGNSFSSEENEISLNRKSKKPSPRTVLDICEGEKQSNSDEESSSLAESCITNTSMDISALQKKPESRRPKSQLKRISSIFRASFDWNLKKRNGTLLNQEKQQPLMRCFSYEEIANATNNFRTENLVGEGGYSEVYRGDLKDGISSIAVKRLAKDNSNANKEKEFLMELGIIGHVNHPNTAQLLGYCIENGLYLIFKLYPNGNLSSALHGETCKFLDWPIRYKIAQGIARGLHYLHKCCKHRIIHRDIKASNVLLGPDYEPQISDFGLAKWLPSKWSHHAVIPIEGTFGYLAPEYFMHGIVDEKTDVFAFGVLLLEIITGRLPVDSTKQNLLLWARPLMESGNLRELMDPKLEGRYDMDQLHRVVLTASYCVRQSSIWRPSMTEVLQLLTNDQDYEISTSWRIAKFTSNEISTSWRIAKFTSNEMDDYSMIFGYDLPSDLTLEDI